jgi:hypothetical protein
MEVKLLMHLRDKDPTDAANIIHLKVRACPSTHPQLSAL